MSTIVFKNIDSTIKKQFEEKLQDTSLTKISVMRQLMKKFVNETADTIDFLFK